jgi:hypothetical protein
LPLELFGQSSRFFLVLAPLFIFQAFFFLLLALTCAVELDLKGQANPLKKKILLAPVFVCRGVAAALLGLFLFF